MPARHDTRRRADALARGLLGSFILLGACRGSRSPPRAPLPLCRLSVAQPLDDPGALTMPAERWFEFLLHEYDRTSRQVSETSRDCSRTLLQWAPSQSTCPREQGDDDSGPTPERPRAHPLSAQHIARFPASGARELVWLNTASFANGDGFGPIALIERSPEGLLVRAFGAVRAPPADLSLRLVAGAPGGAGELLVIEATRCGEEEGSCGTELQLLPRRGARFLNTALWSESGECLGPARIDLSRERLVTLRDGQVRELRSRTLLEEDADGLYLNEEVEEFARGEGERDEDEVPFRSASERRALRVEGDRLMTTGPSIWARTLTRYAEADGRGRATEEQQ